MTKNPLFYDNHVLRGEGVKWNFRETYGANLTSDSSLNDKKHASNCKKISEFQNRAHSKMAKDTFFMIFMRPMSVILA